MIKMIITDAVVSKGYDGAPAIRFYDAEGGSQIAICGSANGSMTAEPTTITAG